MVPWAASLLTLWCWCCCCCSWTQTARTTPGDPPYACPTALRPLVDFTVNYSLPHFQTAQPVQHIQANGFLREFYVASRNLIEAVDQRMERIWAVPTGPVGLGECPGGCGPCDAVAAVPDEEDTPPEDTDNMVLLLDPAGTLLPYLYYCGSTRHGVCFFLDYSELNPVSQCLYKETSNTEAYCPDCLASPLGTQVIVVEQGRTTLFFVATSVDERVMQRYPRRSLSVLRPLATEDGFHMVMRGLTVLPHLWASYPITYIYTFSTAEYVYFLSLQRENPEKSNSPMQTRLGRLPVLIPEVWMYREVVLECRYEPKRRRRRGVERNRDVVYNGLQAAYFGPVGGLLAGQLGVNPEEKLLYGTFAEVDEHGVPQKNSAFCTFPLFQVNQAIEKGVEDCCTGGTEQLSRGLCHYQPCESCPHEVSISLTHLSRGECCWVEGPEAFCPGDQSNRVNLTVRFKIVLL